MNPLGPTFRDETQDETTADPTVPPLPEEEGEPEDPSTELLRRVLAGSREPDVSQVKLAKMPAPTGSRGLLRAKAWQDGFTIKLRTRANVIQPADLPRHGAADRQLAHEICFKHRRQDVSVPPWRRSVVRLRDLERVARRNPCEHGRAHGSTSREVCQACSLPRQNEGVVDAETVARRPQGVAGGGKLAIQRNSDAIPEDSQKWNQRPQQRA